MPNQCEESTTAVENAVKVAVNNYKHHGTASDPYNPKIAGILRAQRSLTTEYVKKINPAHVPSGLIEEALLAQSALQKDIITLQNKFQSNNEHRRLIHTSHKLLNTKTRFYELRREVLFL